MTATLIGALAIIVLTGGGLWAARRWGQAAAYRDIERKRSDVKDDQLAEAVSAPRSIRGLVDRLRRGGF